MCWKICYMYVAEQYLDIANIYSRFVQGDISNCEKDLEIEAKCVTKL